MSRRLLPQRRPSETVEFRHGAIAYRGMASFDVQTGEVIEVFLEGGKPGSEVQATARDAAVTASLALQHGVSLDALRRSLTRLDDGTAAGPMGAFLDQIGGDHA